jgi:hypothetical protein
MGRDIRQILVTVLGPAIVFAALFAMSASWYAVDLSGTPDEGPVPPQLLPWFLHDYRLGGGVWTDVTRLATWVTACLAYLLPAAMVPLFASRRSAAIGGAVVVSSLVTWACVSIPPPPPPSEYVAYFTSATVGVARRWIVALALGGAVAGVVARALWSRARRRHSPVLNV